MAIAGIFLFVLGVSAQAPDQVREKFRKDNPNAMSAVWKTEKDNSYRVTYSDNKVEHAIIYDSNGSVLVRQTVVKASNIPTGITEYYSKRTAGNREYAPSYTVWQSTDPNGVVTYYSEYNGKQAWFDKDGNQLTKQGMTETELQKKDEKAPIDK